MVQSPGLSVLERRRGEAGQISEANVGCGASLRCCHSQCASSKTAAAAAAGSSFRVGERLEVSGCDDELETETGDHGHRPLQLSRSGWTSAVAGLRQAVYQTAAPALHGLFRPDTQRHSRWMRWPRCSPGRFPAENAQEEGNCSSCWPATCQVLVAL